MVAWVLMCGPVLVGLFMGVDMYGYGVNNFFYSTAFQG